MKSNTRQFVDIRTRPNRDSDSRLGPRTRFGDCSASGSDGFSLVEMIVAVTIVAMLVAISLPTIKSMQNSNESTGALSMVEAALHTARSLAISSNAYVGIRFQKAANDDPNLGDASINPLDRNQYMILVIYKGHDVGTDKDVFIAVPGKKPIKLPVNVGVTDMMLGSNELSTIGDSIDDIDIVDTTTFTIVFSPAGKLVRRNAQIRNKDGKANDDSKDELINTEPQIQAGYGMFLQDASEEMSRRSFVIYSRPEFKKAYEVSVPYLQYLQDLKTHYVNPYTGGIIKN